MELLFGFLGWRLLVWHLFGFILVFRVFFLIPQSEVVYSLKLCILFFCKFCLTSYSGVTDVDWSWALLYFFFIHLITAVFCLSFRKFSGVLGAVSGAKSFLWAHWREQCFLCTGFHKIFSFGLSFPSPKYCQRKTKIMCWQWPSWEEWQSKGFTTTSF